MAKAEHRHLYNSKAWQRLRLVAIARDGNRCRMCGCTLDLKGKSKPTSAEVDHREPHHGDRAKFFDLANLQALCKLCHSSTKQRQERGGRPEREDGWTPR